VRATRYDLLHKREAGELLHMKDIEEGRETYLASVFGGGVDPHTDPEWMDEVPRLLKEAKMCPPCDKLFTHLEPSALERRERPGRSGLLRKKPLT
jgi:hypothetical protein